MLLATLEAAAVKRAQPIPAAVLDAVRISVGNQSVARHFWQAALGLSVIHECEIGDPLVREVWRIPHGAPSCLPSKRPKDSSANR